MGGGLLFLILFGWWCTTHDGPGGWVFSWLSRRRLRARASEARTGDPAGEDGHGERGPNYRPSENRHRDQPTTALITDTRTPGSFTWHCLVLAKSFGRSPARPLLACCSHHRHYQAPVMQSVHGGRSAIQPTLAPPHDYRKAYLILRPSRLGLRPRMPLRPRIPTTPWAGRGLASRPGE